MKLGKLAVWVSKLDALSNSQDKWSEVILRQLLPRERTDLSWYSSCCQSLNEFNSELGCHRTCMCLAAYFSIQQNVSCIRTLYCKIRDGGCDVSVVLVQYVPQTGVRPGICSKRTFHWTTNSNPFYLYSNLRKFETQLMVTSLLIRLIPFNNE